MLLGMLLKLWLVCNKCAKPAKMLYGPAMEESKSTFAPLLLPRLAPFGGVQMLVSKVEPSTPAQNKQCPRAHNPYTGQRSNQTMVARKVSLVTGECRVEGK